MDHLVLNLNTDGELNNYTHHLIGLGDDYGAHDEVWPELVTAYDEAYGLLDVVVGKTAIDILGSSGGVNTRGGCRRTDCPAGV